MEIIHEQKQYELNSRIWGYDDIVEFAHWHERIEILQILKSKCRFLVDGNPIEAEEGDLVILKEGSIHLHFKEYETCQYRLIHFPYRLFLDTNTFPGNAKAHITNEEIKAIPDLGENLNTIFEIMDKQGSVVKAEDNLFFAYLIMAVYSELAKHFPEEEGELPVKSEKKEMYRAIEYINAHYKDDINIQKVSDALFISRSRLTGLFKKYLDVSVGEYITRLRIEKANRLIANGHNVTEAALDSGFQSVRTFNSSYKTYMGITPSEYQKMKK